MDFRKVTPDFKTYLKRRTYLCKISLHHCEDIISKDNGNNPTRSNLHDTFQVQQYLFITNDWLEHKLSTYLFNFVTTNPVWYFQHEIYTGTDCVGVETAGAQFCRLFYFKIIKQKFPCLEILTLFLTDVVIGGCFVLFLGLRLRIHNNKIFIYVYRYMVYIRWIHRQYFYICIYIVICPYRY